MKYEEKLTRRIPFYSVFRFFVFLYLSIPQTEVSEACFPAQAECTGLMGQRALYTSLTITSVRCSMSTRKTLTLSSLLSAVEQRRP